MRCHTYAHTQFSTEKKVTATLPLGHSGDFVEVVKFSRRFPNLRTIFRLDAQIPLMNKNEHDEYKRIQ